MTKLEIIWHNVEKSLDDDILVHAEIAKTISQETGYTVAYAEAFIMATKNMTDGKTITRIVGGKILENLAFKLLEKFGDSIRGNILSALQLYMGYEPNKLTNSKMIKDLIQKISGQNKCNEKIKYWLELAD